MPARIPDSTLTHSKRCYESHPPLILPNGLEVYGGNGAYPIIKDADIYIGLCSSIPLNLVRSDGKTPIQFLFSMPNMGVPESLHKFEGLLYYIKESLESGKKVHIGCIGGHGRTGLVLAALTSLYGESNAINYVRNNYCKKAVESTAQIDYLVDFFNVIRVQKRYDSPVHLNESDIKPSLYPTPPNLIFKGD